MFFGPVRRLVLVGMWDGSEIEAREDGFAGAHGNLQAERMGGEDKAIE